MKWIAYMAVVCNLLFNTPSCFAVNASAPGQPDGSIFVSALDGSSVATVRYSLNSDFVYPFGQSSGLFSGLVPGTYTVYARNSTTCRATIELTVGTVSAYAIRYRLDFHDLKSLPTLGSNRKWRLDIEDKEYSGSVSDLEGAGEDPVIVEWRGESSEDIFSDNVISSSLRVALNSRTDQEFIDFYTYDERRFRASLYLYSGGSYGLYWRGFLTPMLYSEPYVSKRNYDVNLIFTDGLADLKDVEFTDDSGNRPQDRIPIFNALNYIINKTNIALNFWETVNLYATGMTFGTDDSTLEQAYIDPLNYRKEDGTNLDCRTVLGYLLDFMGCRLYQSNGRWNIDLISEKTASSVATRKRTENYGLISGGNESPRIMLRVAGAVPPKVTLAEQSGVMSIAQTYGTVRLRYKLGLEEINNLLPYGSFEAEDLDNGQFKGWQADLANNADGYVGLERLTGDRSGYAFFAQFNALDGTETGAAVTRYIELTSDSVNMAAPEGPAGGGIGGAGGPTTPVTYYRIRISFDVYTRPIFENCYIAIDYMLRFTDTGHYLQPGVNSEGARIFSTYTDALLEGKYNRTYIDSHLKWTTISFDCIVDDVDMEGPLEFEFKISGNPIYDHATLASLRAVDTTELYVQQNLTRQRVINNTFAAQHLEYRLRPGTDAESGVQIVRPTNYNGTTNAWVWELARSYGVPGYPVDELVYGYPYQYYSQWLQNILIDNVHLGYLPGEAEPVEEVVVTETPYPGIKQTLEKELFHGDLEAGALDANYKFITRGYLTTSDGEPIVSGWKRRGVTEYYQISQLLGKMIRGQYQEMRRKLSGTLDCPDTMPTLWNTLQEVRTGKVFQFMALTCYLRTNKADFEAIETLSGGDPLDESTNPGGTPGTVEPPVVTRVHSTDFSSDFI